VLTPEVGDAARVGLALLHGCRGQIRGKDAMMEMMRSYWFWVTELPTRELIPVALGVAVVIGLLVGVVVRGIQALWR
jgi:hypothetical protein